MSLRRLAGAFVAAVCPTIAIAQDPGTIAFDKITNGIEHHRKLYNATKMIAGTIKEYLVDSAGGVPAVKLADDWDFENVEDAAGNKRNTVTKSRGKPNRSGTGYYKTPDIYYAVKPDAGGYRVADFLARADSPQTFAKRTTEGPAELVSSFDGVRSLDFLTVVLRDRSHLACTLALEKPSRATWGGREVVAVRSRLTPTSAAGKTEQKPVAQTSYFDLQNNYVFLGCESSTASSTDHPWPHTKVCTLEYSPPAKGKLPTPKRFTRTVQKEGGSKLVVYDVEFTQYQDYVPDAEEFRLEKRYGLTTPVGPEDKTLVGVHATPFAFRVWYWAAAVAGGLLFAWLVTHLYRRRRAAKHMPATAKA